MSKQGANPEKHTHILEDGTVIEHTHGAEESSAPHDGVHTHTHDSAHTHTHDGTHTHTHGAHSHTHDPEHVKSVLNRISRAIGHLESIKRMVEDGRDCSEVLIQLSAVKAAINNTGKVILQDHIAHCLVDAVETGDMETIEELNKAIDRFIK
ncbi:MAG: metal-sensing transcriptional repressor [Marvinbryantia sp.]|uniref:metal-sensing transcriptional repressor n=1 Tax=Marvinbryantia sp. TaxID=2496532 RepID=UPI00399B57B2